MKLCAALAVLLSLAAARPATASVQAGPIVYPANGRAYYLLAPAPWSAAETEAQALGGHLVAIDDAAENTWVWETFAGIASGPFWIGLTDAALEGTFVWTSGDPFDYASWWTAGGEPNNAGGIEHYVELNNYLWNDNAGASAFRGVVEVAGFAFVEAEEIPPPPPSAVEEASLYGLAVSPDGRHLYALYDVAIGADRMLIYERGALGALTLIDSPQVAANPNGMAMAPDGSALFVLGNNGELQAWRRDPATGLLAFADQVYDGSTGGNYLLTPLGVAVSPDGAHVYVAGLENAVTSFAWDGAALTLIDTDVTGTGGLVLSGPGPIAVTQDGLYMLVVSLLDNSLAGFFLNPPTGNPFFVERLVDGMDGVDGLASARAIVTAPAAFAAPSSFSVYVSGSADQELAFFSVAPSGPGIALTFEETVSAGSAPYGLAVSPDATRLYVTDETLDRVAAFERDPATGALGAVVDEISDAAPGVDGLDAASHVAVSPDGRNVYVASSADDAIAVLLTPEPGGALLGVAALLGLRRVARRRRAA